MRYAGEKLKESMTVVTLFGDDSSHTKLYSASSLALVFEVSRTGFCIKHPYISECIECIDSPSVFRDKSVFLSYLLLLEY